MHIHHHHWQAIWRDTVLLVRQFRMPLLAFVLVMLGAGTLYSRLAEQAGESPDGIVHAVYLVLALSFFQPSGDFPHAWYLQAFYFVMPVIGISILAQGLADFGVSLFNRHARSKEWEMAVASTFSNHVILIGLGHLGFRVVRKLYDVHQEVVVIELKPDADLVASVRAMGIPVLQEDGTRETALEAAGVRRAHAIMLCTQNDSLNLQMAVKARSMNPNIRVILRIFDDDFADALEKQFGFTALSATGMAAPVFAAAAAQVDITRPITVEGHALSLARMEVPARSSLVGMTVSELEGKFDVSVVLLRRNNQSDLHPSADRTLAARDMIAVLGEPARIEQLMSAGH
ncbi:MAG: TrkA family potassium uptake protein [Chloroflexi bacterium]|nr:TrkA family potassium uptake protein [Chloroflexota bacterium]